MEEKRKGLITLDGLDGAREREFDLPDNWDELSDDQRQAVYYPVKLQLMEDSVSWGLEIDGEDDEDEDEDE